MPDLRPEEEWARRIVSAELRVRVDQYDDGSRHGMHDLEAVAAGGRRIAIEVTAAVDAEATELWNIVNGDERWIEPDLAGGWGVTVLPNGAPSEARVASPSSCTREGRSQGRETG